MSSDLPNDPAQLQALLVESNKQREDLLAQNRILELKVRKMEAKVQALMQQYFGRSSEKLDPNQLHLALEAAQADIALAEEESPVPAKPRTPSDRRARRLEDLPVLERVYLDVSPEEKIAPDGTPMVKIREEITDLVDYRPGCLFRRQIVRPVYACPSHATPPRIAPLPPRVVPSGQVASGLVAHVVISKFCDHLPIHRQEQMLARLGPTFTRQAMGQWVNHSTLLLQSVHSVLRTEALEGRYIQMDETPISVLDPERAGKARDAWLWAVHSPEKKIVIFEFHKTRSHAPPKQLLDGFKGVLQTDGFSAYDTALNALPGHAIIRAACMAHARRGFMEALESGDDRATPFLILFGKLYKVEAEARDLDPVTRALRRAEHSVPLLLQLHQRFLGANADPSVLPQGDLAQAINYCLARWTELGLFTEPGYGHIQIDNNPIERQIRPTKLGLRNWLFIGHPDAGDNPAVIYSIIGTCKLNKIDPWAYLNWALPGLAAATNRTAADFTPQRFAAL
jgi:transposase